MTSATADLDHVMAGVEVGPPRVQLCDRGE